MVGSTEGTQKEDPKLVGTSNETDIEIGGHECRALLDTGSCVSIISESYWRDNMGDQHPLNPIQDFIHIECADGKPLPYLGYISTEVRISTGIPKSSSVTCLLLVTPDTKYASQVPVILGTNIMGEFLRECKDNFGNQYLQRANLHVPWFLAFRCIEIRDKDLKKNKNRIAIVKSANMERVMLGPNESKFIPCFTDKEIPVDETLAMMAETENTGLPDYVDITPSVINYKHGHRKDVMVNISNLTTDTVVISPRTVICELQPVTVQSGLDIDEEDMEVLKDLKIDADHLLNA